MNVAMWLAQALEKWHDFYTLVGTAAATLVALLFVAISLGIGFLTHARARATRTFISPVVFHFAAVLFLSAIALIPLHHAPFFAALIGAAGAVGIAVSIYTTVRLLQDWKDVTDRLAYGLLPVVSYAAAVAAAVLIATRSEWALDVLAGAQLSLLLVNIRNAWDLALSMVRSQGEHNTQQ